MVDTNNTEIKSENHLTKNDYINHFNPTVYLNQFFAVQNTNSPTTLVEEWKDNKLNVFDWKTYFNFILDKIPQDNDKNLVEYETKLRQALINGKLFRCDVNGENSLFVDCDEPEDKFDMIYTKLCLEAACSTSDVLQRTMNRFTELLKPGGMPHYKERGLSHRDLRDKFQVSIGAVSNILKRKHEYMSDYETNLNRNVKRKVNQDFRQIINDSVYEWFIAQRAKKIPVSGPILQEYARKIAQEIDGSSGFKASNGWLERFRNRYNVRFRIISGEAGNVNNDTIEDWKTRLTKILENSDPVDVYNCDETGLFFKLMPDRSLVVNNDDCIGGKKSKERFTVWLCTNWAGTVKLKPVVIGKAAKPRCFKNLDMTKLPVTWCSNSTAWMNSTLFTNWLCEFDKMIQKQERQILLFLDNAPVHPPDIKLTNITLKFFSANTTAVIQPLDQGIIRNFKAYYRRHLVQHIIANANRAYSTDDITTIRNTFKAAGFDKDVVSPDSTLIQTTFTNEDNVAQENKCLQELDNVLKHVTISGDVMSAVSFVSVDDDLPVFNQWNDGSEKRLVVDGISNDDTPNDDDLHIEEPPPSLSEAIKLLRRLHLLSTTQHPELHPYLTQLQSKLIDIYLDSNISKQRSIRDFFKPDQQQITTDNFDLTYNLPPRPILRLTAIIDIGAIKLSGDESENRATITPPSNISHNTSNLDEITYVIHKAIIDNLIKNPKTFQGGKEDELKEAFLSPFHDELAFKKLESYPQGINRPVRSFYNEVLKLCTETDPEMSESMKLRHLLKKAKPTLQYEIRKRKPTATKQFLEYAKESEELLQLSNIDTDVDKYDRNNSNSPKQITSTVTLARTNASNAHIDTIPLSTYDRK
ncbi:unnamed protein product [Rotaria magnacalcarata]|uniref:HTH CENPB-type domain-containing protein n=1 Tax=Rotaria magnacalcarata TaxID=392030 RepID=A0A816MMR4_9BILA|nr:unnamed protein product [Rotaria magnacalcarata]